MKHKIKLLVLLSLCLLFSSCTKPVDISEESSKSSIPGPSQILETSDKAVENNENDAYRDVLLNGHTLETNKEVFELFVFLLENGADITTAEVANKGSLRDDYDNVNSTYWWYSQRELGNIKLDVLETKDLGSRSTGGLYDDYKAGESFYLKVDVTDKGSSNVPLGQQEWVFQTIEPVYSFAALTPDELITFEEYTLRKECAEYTEYTDLIKGFIQFGINGAFNSFSDIPDDLLIHYIVYTVPTGEDGTLTQEEVNQAGKELFGLDSLTPSETMTYDLDTKTFTPYGYGPPYPNDYFKRVVVDGDGTHFDYSDGTTGLRYTIRDEKVVMAVDISDEAAKVDYGEITGIDEAAKLNYGEVAGVDED